MANLHNINEEKWLPVFGYEGLYEVSNLARVRSMVHTMILKKVNHIAILQEKYLSKTKEKNELN
jgi:hypothetical protein